MNPSTNNTSSSKRNQQRQQQQKKKNPSEQSLSNPPPSSNPGTNPNPGSNPGTSSNPNPTPTSTSASSSRKSSNPSGKYSSHKRGLKEWFSNLSEEKRRHVISIVDSELTYGLLCMYDKKLRDGDGYFFEVDVNDIFKPLVPSRNIKTYRQPIDPPGRLNGNKRRKRGLSRLSNDSSKALPFNFVDDFFLTKKTLRKTVGSKDENFCFTKFQYVDPEFVYAKIRDADQELEDAIRLCDTKEYMDTLTLDPSLVKDPELFFQIMHMTSRGNFLTSECKVCWSAEQKRWKWEMPSWFNEMGFYTFATYVEQKIETQLWMRYWEAIKLDPRRGSQHPFNFSPVDYCGLASKEHLVEYWKSLTIEQRRGVVGKMGRIVSHVLKDGSDIDMQSYPKLLSILFTMTKTNSPQSFMSKLKTDEDFIDFVFFSSPIGLILILILLSERLVYYCKHPMQIKLLRI